MSSTPTSSNSKNIGVSSNMIGTGSPLRNLEYPQFSTQSPLKRGLLEGNSTRPESSTLRNSYNSTLRSDLSFQIGSSLSIDMINQHDLIFKQMDRQRAELYQRMQDRIQRAKQLGHICKDQINYLKSKIMDLEERINEANNEHFNKHVLQIDPKTAIDSLSAILSDDGEDITELNRSKISDKSLNSSLFSDSKHNLDE